MKLNVMLPILFPYLKSILSTKSNSRKTKFVIFKVPYLCELSYGSGSQPGVHGPLSGPQKISGGPQDSKFCVTVNRRGSTVKKG